MATEDKSYGWLGVDMPRDIALRMAILQRMIKKEDLYEDKSGFGLEKHPHVTVAYGHEENDPQSTREAIADLVAGEGKLGGISVFDTNPDYKVLKFDVDSPDLHSLNQRIRERIKLPGLTFNEYNPHVTVAYLKKHVDPAKYEKLAALLSGRKFPIKMIRWSNPANQYRTLLMPGVVGTPRTLTKTASDVKYRIRPGSTRYKPQDGEIVSMPSFRALATVDGKQVGIAEILRNFHGKDLFRSFKVNKDQRGKGVGTELLRRLFEHADKEGIDVLHTRANPYEDEPMTREQLMKLYAKFGFEPTNEEGDELPGGGWPVGKGPGAMIRKKADSSGGPEIQSQEEIFEKVRKMLPRGVRHASGGLPDARGLSDVDIALVKKKHDDMLEQFPEGTTMDTREDRTIYSVPGYDRPVEVYVGRNKERVKRSLKHRLMFLRLQKEYPELVPEAAKLKAQGMGTEEAWATLLGLEGDQYEVMLDKPKVMGAAKKLMSKTAGTNKERLKSFLLSGEVQGMGVRKTIHEKLNELGRRGIAVNDARTGKVHATLPADVSDEVLDAVRASLKEQKAPEMGVEPTRARPLKPLKLTVDDLVTLVKEQGLTRTQAKMEAAGGREEAIRKLKDYLKPRYQLRDEGDHLVGELPALARKQLQGEEPMYKQQLTGENDFGPNKFLRKAAQIILDIEKGDKVLVGRFKNKEVTVESIGTDENGQPTINGRKLLSLRIKKLLPEGGPVAATTSAKAKELNKEAAAMYDDERWEALRKNAELNKQGNVLTTLMKGIQERVQSDYSKRERDYGASVSPEKYHGLSMPENFKSDLKKDIDKIKAIVNGMGSPRTWWYSLHPDTMYGMDLTPVSDIHDYEYTYPSKPFATEEEAMAYRDAADQRFKENILKLVERHSSKATREAGIDEKRKAMAEDYYRLLRMAGPKTFLKIHPIGQAAKPLQKAAMEKIDIPRHMYPVVKKLMEARKYAAQLPS